MRRRAGRVDPLAEVPADLREFVVDDWLPFVEDDEPTERAAVQRWLDARRRWVAEHGYPGGDPLPWLLQNHDTRRDVERRANTEESA